MIVVRCRRSHYFRLLILLLVSISLLLFSQSLSGVCANEESDKARETGHTGTTAGSPAHTQGQQQGHSLDNAQSSVIRRAEDSEEEGSPAFSYADSAQAGARSQAAAVGFHWPVDRHRDLTSSG